MACSTKSASSRPGPAPGPVAFRGVRLGLPICEDIWGPDVVESLTRDRRGNPAVAQWLALLARQGRRAPRGRHGAGGRERPAAGLSQPDRRTGRTGVRRREFYRQRRLAQSPAACRLSRNGRQGRLPPRERRAGSAKRRPTRRCSTTTRPITPPACWACAITSQKNNFPGVVLGMSGGVDLALCAAHGGGRLGPTRSMRSCCPSLHLRGIAARTRRTAPSLWACAMTSCRSPRPSRASRRRWRRFSPGRRAA